MATEMGIETEKWSIWEQGIWRVVP